MTVPLEPQAGEHALAARAGVTGRDGDPPIDVKAVAICVFAAVAYLLSHFEGSVEFYVRHLAPHLPHTRFDDIAGDLFWLAMSNVYFGVLPFGLLLLLREPLPAYGLGLGNRKLGLAITGSFLLVMLPLTLGIAKTTAFHGAYPLNQNAARDWAHFLLWETLYLGYFAGWEFFHRSYLLFGLRQRIGNLAIFVAAIPFTLEHFGKPEPEAWGSLVAGIALGILAVRARSFWYGAALHCTIAFTMDVAQSWPRLRHGA